jgi:hypothetical protein
MGGSCSTEITVPRQDAPIEDKSPDLARDFVDRVLAMVERIKRERPQPWNTVQALSFDEMYATAKRMLAAREEFRKLGKPIRIVLRHHYTRREHVASIRKHGLLNRAERAARGVKIVKYNGNSYGPGIYMASNPFAYRGVYGNVGLLVACLEGTNEDLYGRNKMSPKKDSGTVYRHSINEVVILSCSKQCVPVLQFEASQTNEIDHSWNEKALLGRYPAELKQILNDLFVEVPVAPKVCGSTAPVAATVEPNRLEL